MTGADILRDHAFWQIARLTEITLELCQVVYLHSTATPRPRVSDIAGYYDVPEAQVWRIVVLLRRFGLVTGPLPRTDRDRERGRRAQQRFRAKRRQLRLVGGEPR